VLKLRVMAGTSATHGEDAVEVNFAVEAETTV
jgi:hypothetical protein